MPKILVVDDDQTISEFVGWALSDEGYEVTTAPNGAAALRLLEQMRPDVILLDMRMPVMDGWQFARTYRDGRNGAAPIVVLTAAKDAAQRAEEIAADGYLAKPFELDDLLEVVGRFAFPAKPSL